MTDLLTPVDWFDGYWAKREDLACYERPDWPTGAKVRQYAKMIEAQPGQPLLVGCSAFSAMPIYIAACAEKYNLPAIIYTPGRAKQTDSVRYAVEHGVEVCEVRPCPGPSVYQARARERGKQLGEYVHWDFHGAIADAQFQASNLPVGVKRVLIPTGSGLIATGVLAGLAGRNLEVVAVAVSTMAHERTIIDNASKLTQLKLPEFKVIRATSAYDRPMVKQLPDGTPLDPYYAAKLTPYVRRGDCLWLTGLRPVSAMPQDCRKAFANWSGPS